MPGLISLLISLVILGLVLWVFWWILSLIPAPEPIATIIKVVFALICLVALLSLVFGGWSFPLGGYGHPSLGRP
jgi:heme A synthase